MQINISEISLNSISKQVKNKIDGSESIQFQNGFVDFNFNFFFTLEADVLKTYKGHDSVEIDIDCALDRTVKKLEKLFIPSEDNNELAEYWQGAFKAAEISTIFLELAYDTRISQAS